MPTQEIPDDELDDLFRKAAEEHVEVYDSEAWGRMEQLLDGKGGRGGALLWWKTLLLVLGLLVGTLGIWWLAKPDVNQKEQIALEGKEELQHQKEINDNSDNTGENRQHTVVLSKKPNDTITEKAITTLRTDKPGVADYKREPAVNPQKNTPKTTNVTDERKGKTASSPTAKNSWAKKRRNKSITEYSFREEPTTQSKERFAKHIRSKKRSVQNQEPTLLSSQQSYQRRKKRISPTPSENLTAPVDASLMGNLNSNPEGPSTTGETGMTKLYRVVYDSLAGKTISIIPPQPLRAGDVPEQETVDYYIERPPPAKPYRLSAGILFSPDLSSVGFFNVAMPGTNVGAKLEYRLSNRLSINTGLVRSVKIYSASPEDYHPPYGTWSYGKRPSSIDAKCKILDIPINLRFDFMKGEKYSAFISNGLSSYIMLSERYNYSYDVPNPHLIQSWKGTRTGNYYFSVYNVSVGYERQFNKRLSWHIEPFLKLPLGGVGFGKVKLLSTGVFLTARYQLLR